MKPCSVWRHVSSDSYEPLWHDEGFNVAPSLVCGDPARGSGIMGFRGIMGFKVFGFRVFGVSRGLGL